MNLLELMLKEEIEWPVGAEFAAHDGDDCTVFFYRIKPNPVIDDSWSLNEEKWPGRPSAKLHGLSCDWSTRIITREEYQDAGGWMQYSGSGIPVSGSDLCVAMLENEGSTYNAEFMGWNRAEWEGKDGVIKKYRVIKQVSVQLDNQEIEPDFEPFVSVEDAQECKTEHSITPSKYTKQIHGVSVDVYDVLMAWEVTNPALQHLIKKALQCGKRGHKDKQQDLQDIIDSAIRAKELEQ